MTETNMSERRSGREGVDPKDVPCAEKPKGLRFDEIQGNIFDGFLKDQMVTILFGITSVSDARATLRPGIDTPEFAHSVFNHVQHSLSEAVLVFNDQFRALRHAGVPEGTIKATWTNIVLTAAGMATLLGAEKLEDFPEAFKGGQDNDNRYLGMIGRTDEIGDLNDNAPDHWNDGMGEDGQIVWECVDGAILVASDDEAQLDEGNPSSRLGRYLATFAGEDSGITVLGVIRGETRVDDVGHEHFGFKDGVSQPGIRGVDPADDPLHNPDQGNPGQDLLHPGEFVLGYPRQIPLSEPDHDGPNRCPGIIAGKNFYKTDPEGSKTILPDWAMNGSFLVFRRLAQDVRGFRAAVVRIAGEVGTTPDLLGAKLVGRYRSGAPLEALKFQSGDGEYTPPAIDPGIAKPALANSSTLNNRFEYGDDKEGDIVPLAAHIRKAYPRDQEPEHETGLEPKTEDNKDEREHGAESRTQTHRLLRRGIPFGKSLGAETGGGPDDPRGLLFFAYQSDIARQFEFVQRSWVDDKDFPRLGAGQDPILANDTENGDLKACPFHQRGKPECVINFRHFVKTRGGQYFFSPSKSTLETWLTTP